MRGVVQTETERVTLDVYTAASAGPIVASSSDSTFVLDTPGHRTETIPFTNILDVDVFSMDEATAKRIGFIR